MPRFIHQDGRKELCSPERFQFLTLQAERAVREAEEKARRAALPKRNPIMSITQSRVVGDDGILRFKDAHLAVEAAAKNAALAWSKRMRDRLRKAVNSTKEAFAHRAVKNGRAEVRYQSALAREREAREALIMAKRALGRAGLSRGDLNPEARNNIAARLAWPDTLARLLVGYSLVIENPNNSSERLPAPEVSFSKLVAMDAAVDSTKIGAKVYARQGKAEQRLKDLIYPKVEEA
jgi:hypothetical protein